MRNFLTHILSGHSMQFIIILIINTLILLSSVLWEVTLWEVTHCVHAACVPVFQCHALKRHWKKVQFFLAPDFVNFVISRYCGEYGQWISTRNVRKKIMHALHLKWTIFVKYSSSYIKRCQTGTYFFGVECTLKIPRLLLELYFHFVMISMHQLAWLLPS